MSKVALPFPPYWTPAMPHLALPALLFYPRTRGVAVCVRLGMALRAI
jgi:hypothetical protein